MKKIDYNRVLLKFSGEALAGGKRFGIDNEVLDYITDEILSLNEYDLDLGIVIGGGNIFRGVDITTEGVNRIRADYMGMLGTVINGIAIQDYLIRKNAKARVMSAVRMDEVAEPMIIRKAEEYFEEGYIIIFTGGTGRPFFSTDSGAALRAAEIDADLLIKATKVDGVYSDDPEKNKEAKLYKKLDYKTAIHDKLGVMDTTAFSLCEDNEIPIMVYNMMNSGALKESLISENVGTLITKGG
ncbi:MAG: UMP kinase [Candidatus Marinimicrobia bacterium]|nr:UMP kinase [Candidatus Neomarinimicrobiota bacterium]